jgi:hypothetical protein
MLTYVNTPFGLAVQNVPKWLIGKALTYVNTGALPQFPFGGDVSGYSPDAQRRSGAFPLEDDRFWLPRLFSMDSAAAGAENEASLRRTKSSPVKSTRPGPLQLGRCACAFSPQPSGKGRRIPLRFGREYGR